jgi:hypothetical protein
MALAGAAGASARGLGADATGRMDAIAPTFGAILASIGDGVANAQTALDQSVVQTVQALAETKITVVSEVIEVLDDDGLPDVEKTELITQNVSVLNYVTPTVHEWKHVALNMDMQVSAVDNETGMEVSVSQSQSETGSAGLLGFLSVGYYAHSDSYQNMISNTHYESEWAQGQVTMDAVLGPRNTTKFPVPASVSIGPQIFFSQGKLDTKSADGVVTERSVELLITVRKASGDVNPGVGLLLDPAGLLPAFSTENGYTGSTTNTEGKCLVKLTRAIPNPAFAQASRRTVKVTLGQITKTYTLTI